MRAMMASCGGDGINSPRHVESWLFVQNVRCEVSKQVSTICSHLSAITFPDLEEAAFRCGAATEHFDQAAAYVLNPKVVGTARTQAKFNARNDELALLYLDTVQDGNTVELGLLSRICEALRSAIYDYYWNICPMVAKSIKKSVKHRCKDEYDALQGMITLSNAASPASSHKRKFAEVDSQTFSSGETVDLSSRIRDILGQLEDLLRRHGLTGAAAAVGAGGHSRGTGGLLDSATADLNARLRRRMDTRSLSVQNKPRSALERREADLWTLKQGQLKEVIQSLGLTITQKKPGKPSLIKLIIDSEFPGVAKSGRALASAAGGGAAM